MGLITEDTFICLDCETTGLNEQTDTIVEVAAVEFNFSSTLNSFETLIDPECIISESSIAIHHITQDMVQGKPKVREVLPFLIKFIGKSIIVGHGIGLDLAFIAEAAKKNQISFSLNSYTTIDTLRMARLYGESPTNSLEKLREHFNIRPEGAHRALSDVIVNISVFKYLSKKFKTTEQLLERLKKPILLKTMPLGKYRGRRFNEIPVEYLQWASHADFDMDLLFSVRTELQKRKKGGHFLDAINPFSHL